MTGLPIVLIHGGGLDSRCWNRLVPFLEGPSLAVDLPGRGTRSVPHEEVTFAACAQAVRDDVDRAGFAEIVLVGHSLAGCSMPSMIQLLGDRIRHAVFVACTVPEHGRSACDMLDPAIQEMLRNAEGGQLPRMNSEIAKIVLGSDLTEEQFAWCEKILVAEALSLNMQPVDLSPLRSSILKTWIRTLDDIIVPASRQLTYAENVGDCAVIDIDAGHMCMVSKPQQLADMLNLIASRYFVDSGGGE